MYRTSKSKYVSFICFIYSISLMLSLIYHACYHFLAECTWACPAYINYVCGSDGVSYLNICELVKADCLHGSTGKISAACIGSCPCDDKKWSKQKELQQPRVQVVTERVTTDATETAAASNERKSNKNKNMQQNCSSQQQQQKEQQYKLNKWESKWKWTVENVTQ